jgi:hypothetical protein
MTNFKQSNGEDYPAAAKKHCIDARVLLNQSRFDGAAYLSGYALECMLKTIIQVEEKHNNALKAHKHDIEKWSAEVIRLVVMPNSRTARYFPKPKICGINYADPPSGWKETLRYYPENIISSQIANNWVTEVECMYENVIFGLLKDGEVKA